MTATTETGRTLAGGRYRLDELLGAGAMGAVWRAYDTRLHRQIAVKELAGPLASEPRQLIRFRREAQVAGALSHPNLVRVFDCALDADRPYLVMEHVDGGTLAERLRDGQGPGDCRGLARQLLDALAHLHAAGLVHRDLHPGNVLIGSDGRPRVTGFGTVLPLDAAARAGHGVAAGTAHLTAPEVRAGEGATPASDLYALGVMVGECTGGDGPAALERLVERLTADDPADRPISAAVALQELEAQAATPSSAAAVRRAAGEPRFTRDPEPAGARRATTGSTPVPRRRTTASTPAVHVPHPRRPRRIAMAALAVTTAIVAFAVLTAGEDDPAPPPDPVPAAQPRSEQGSDVDRSLDRLEQIVRGAQERR